MRLRSFAAILLTVAAVVGVSAPAAVAAPGVVTGRLVDTSGVGVAGGQICPTGPMTFPCSMVTADDGVFWLSVDEATTALRASASGFGGSPFVPTSFPVAVTPDGVDVGDIVVARYATITGIVRDPNGATVANAMVSTCPSCSPVFTDGTGRYTLSNIVPGDVTVTAFVQGLPTPPWYPGSAAVTVASGATVVQDLTLVRGTVVSGLVTNPDGSPVGAGTSVVWQLTSAAPPGIPSMGIATDATGRYTTPALPAGSLVLLAGPSATGARVTTAPIAIGFGETRTVDLQLGAGGWVVGTVTGNGGAPLAGVTVTIPGVPATTTAADGTYRTKALPAGSSTLTARPPFGSPYAPATRTLTIVAGQPTVADIVLGAAGTITGTLAGPTGPMASIGVTACFYPALSPCTSAGTNGSGTFTITGLAAGTYSINTLSIPNAQPPFGGASASPVVVASGATTVQHLQLGTSATIGNAGGTVLAGSTLTTMGAATTSNVVVTSVRSPIQTSVSVFEGVPATIANTTILGQAIELHGGAPATAADPFIVTFTVDASAFGSVDPLSADLRRNGDVVADCADLAGTAATPDPCVASRLLDGEGDLVVVARTSAFSVWAVTTPAATAIEPFPLTGFFPPIRSGVEVNAARAGRTVPVKFSLGGDRGLDVLAEGSPSSRAVGCSTTEAAVVPDQSAEPSALRYDAEADDYVYLWRTSPTWTGCRELTVRFVTGQELKAVFRFS